MSERTTDTGSVESEKFFENLPTAVIRDIYKPPSPEYDPASKPPDGQEECGTARKDKKRKQINNPRPMTRSKRGETEKDKDNETQTDPSRTTQTEPGPSRVPLSPGVKVKRARTELERIDPKMALNENLNEKTIGDAYPLPNITDILDQLGSAKYFSILDLASGFHQILMSSKDARKTAFSTPYGHYQFKRMPFGLKNAPTTFQRLMDNVLSRLQGN